MGHGTGCLPGTQAEILLFLLLTTEPAAGSWCLFVPMFFFCLFRLDRMAFE